MTWLCHHPLLEGFFIGYALGSFTIQVVQIIHAEWRTWKAKRETAKLMRQLRLS